MRTGAGACSVVVRWCGGADLVVRDQDDAILGVLGGVDAGRHRLERVDVEARVGLVKDGELGAQQRHLKDLVALLLAAREAAVDVAPDEVVRHAHLGRSRVGVGGEVGVGVRLG